MYVVGQMQDQRTEVREQNHFIVMVVLQAGILRIHLILVVDHEEVTPGRPAFFQAELSAFFSFPNGTENPLSIGHCLSNSFIE